MPPHVPIVLLLGGGSGVFSADCCEALQQCGINPEWIGSYRVLHAKKVAAEKVVTDWQTAVRSGVTPPPPPVPTFEQRWLASSTVGHLTQDAAHRRGARGDNCRTLVDGYTDRGAPAMMNLGKKEHAGTVESDVSATEQTRNAARRVTAASTGSDAYPIEPRHEDQNACMRTAVESQRRNFPDGLASTPHPSRPGDVAPTGAELTRLDQERQRAIESARAGSGAALGNTGTPGSAATASGPAGGAVPLISPKSPGASAEEQALECLQGYRDAMETPAARLASLDEEIKEQQARLADGAQMAEHESKRAALEQRVRDAEAAESAAEKRVTAAEQGMVNFDNAVKGMTVQQRDFYEKKRLDPVLREAEAAQQNLPNRQNDTLVARQALADHTQMHPNAQIQCLQTQRGRILAEQGETTGRIPGASE